MSVVDLRLLEVRSGLFFEYAQLKREDKHALFFLPFWENPIITENKEARLVEYELINRGSTIFTHTGAMARALNIEFTLTLPHIMRSFNAVDNMERLVKSWSTKAEKERFNNINPFETEVKNTNVEEVIGHWQELVYGERLPRQQTGGNTGWGKWGAMAGRPSVGMRAANEAYLGQGTYAHAYETQDPMMLELANNEFEREFGDSGATHPSQDPVAYQDSEGNVGAIPAANVKVAGVSKTALKAMNTLVYILNIIRTSVAGNAENTVLGPPLLRLRHGAAWMDVPLICRSYDISIEEEAGYNLKTLLPNRMKVTLNTSELRAGDFDKFEPGVAVRRDNLAGWEAVIQGEGSIDPGYLSK